MEKCYLTLILKLERYQRLYSYSLIIELIFRWSITVFKALLILCLGIWRMSLFIEKDNSELSEERESRPSINILSMFCRQTESKLFKKFLEFLTKADRPWSFRCKLLLFIKCCLTLMLLWQIKCVFSLVCVSFKSLFIASAFYLRNDNVERYLKRQLHWF